MNPPAAAFAPLADLPGVRAAFFPRLSGVDVATDRATALERLAPLHAGLLRQNGFDPSRLATAEQIHGHGVAVVSAPGVQAGVDALVTAEPGLPLGIYVADCAAVFLADRAGRAVALVHSGRAGTEANIVGRTLEVMREQFGVEPDAVTAHLSPCIRPPLYETDFAAAIAAQARAAGVGEVRDDGICTGQRVDCYYSYRVERGRTGRMLAVLALNS